MEDGRPNVGEDIPEGREKTWDVFGSFHDRSPFGPGRTRPCAGRILVGVYPPGVRQPKGPDLVAKVRDSLKEPPGVMENAWSGPVRVLSSVKCFSMTRAPRATAPRGAARPGV